MKLPRLQLHLSTCIVLMFVAGGLLWANAVPHKIETENIYGRYDVIMIKRGWPAASNCYDLYTAETVWSFRNFALNVLVILAILAAVAFVCEWIIRRRNPNV